VSGFEWSPSAIPVHSSRSPRFDKLDLLQKLFTTLVIPPAVEAEVTPTLSALPDWVAVRTLTQPLHPAAHTGPFGPGEKEAISLGLEIRAARIILDDQPARRLAQRLRLPVVGPWAFSWLLSAWDT